MGSHAALALCGGESHPVLSCDWVWRPVATVLELSVEVVQQVTHELVGILLLIAPK